MLSAMMWLRTPVTGVVFTVGVPDRVIETAESDEITREAARPTSGRNMRPIPATGGTRPTADASDQEWCRNIPWRSPAVPGRGFGPSGEPNRLRLMARYGPGGPGPY